MKTQEEKIVRRNKVLAAMTVLGGLAILVLLILLSNCCNSKKELLLEKAKVEFQNDSLQEEISALKAEIDSLKLLYLRCLGNQGSLTARMDILEENIENNSIEIKILKKENQILKMKISKIADSLEAGINLPVPEIILDTTALVEEDSIKKDSIVTKNLSIKIEKTSYDKKDVEKKVNLLNYSTPISFSSLNGFSKDSLNYLYRYLNENSDSIRLNFHSFIEEENISLNILENNLVLFSEDKEFQLGAGGLLIKNDSLLGSITINWSREFLERISNPKKSANLKFFGGLGILAYSSASFGYWSGKTDIKRVYIGDKLVSEKDFRKQNLRGEILSGLGVLAGLYFTIDGAYDKWGLKTNNSEITFYLNLE